MQPITPRELKEKLDSSVDLPILLDVREEPEYAHCRIEGSLLIPMGRIPMSLDRIEPDREIVAICHHGVRSLQVAQYLEHQGFEKVMNLIGGIDRWAIEIDPAMQRY